MILIGLGMVFATALMAANVIAGKIIAIGGWEMSAGIIAYPLTFLLTDTIAEVYGRKATTRVVWFGFACSLMMTALIYLGGALPIASVSAVSQESFDGALGSVPRIVLASMLAYLVAQNHDVLAFHFWRRKTDGTPSMVQKQRIHGGFAASGHRAVHAHRILGRSSRRCCANDFRSGVHRQDSDFGRGHAVSVRAGGRNPQTARYGGKIDGAITADGAPNAA